MFRKRDFVLMWVAQLVSTAGSSLTDLAAGIYVYQQTNSAFLVGVTLMVTAIPSLIVGLIAGVFVDRYDRRSVMIASNLGQAIVVAIIPFLIGVDVALLFVAILINAGVKQFFDPAYEALIPEIASDDELTAANAFLQIASFGSTAIGFAAAGLIASAYSISWAFWIDAADVRGLGHLHLPDKVRASPRSPTRKRRSASWSTTSSWASARSWTRRCCATCSCSARPCSSRSGCGTCCCCRWRSGAGRDGVRVRAPGGPDLGRVRGGLAVHGQVRGAAPDGPVGVHRHPRHGHLGVFYGLSPTIAIGIMWVMLSGFFNSPSAVARQTLLQRNTPRELRGRVFSALFVMRDVIFLVGMAGAGLADIVDVRVMIILASLILCVVGVVALFVPGIGRPAAEWRRGLSALRAARAA